MHTDWLGTCPEYTEGVTVNMSQLMDKLATYGVDIAETMERFVEDEDLYAECLTSFLEDEAFDALKAALDTPDYRMAFEHAHTLKGIAGNMGLTPLFHEICGMVEDLRANKYDDLGSHYDGIMREFSIVRTFL